MLQHWVLMQLKDEITDIELRNLGECVDALSKNIPGVVCASAGRNLHTLNKERYDFGISIIFQDREALDAYFSHPYHRHMADNYVHLMRKGDLQVFDCPMQE